MYIDTVENLRNCLILQHIQERPEYITSHKLKMTQFL